MTLRAEVVTTIRPDTVFVPYHWAGRDSVNQLTIAAQDPVSKIPEYKVCAVRVSPAAAPAGRSGLPIALPVHGSAGSEAFLVRTGSPKERFPDPPQRG